MAPAFDDEVDHVLVAKQRQSCETESSQSSRVSRLEQSKGEVDNDADNKYGMHEIKLERSSYHRWRKSAILEDFDLGIVLLAAFLAAQYRTTGASELTVDTQIPATKSSGTAPLRSLQTTIEDSTCFEDLLAQISGRLAQGPYSDPSRATEQATSLQQTGTHVEPRFVFSFQERPSELESHPENTCALDRAHGSEITWQVWATEEDLCGSVYFAVGIVDQDSIISLISVYLEVLKGGLDGPTTPIAQLPLAFNLDRIVERIDRTYSPHNTSVYEVFSEQVSSHPNAIAVKDSSQTLTYSELDILSQKVSNWLARRQYAAETQIAVLAARSVTALIGYIGILGANYAYVPLDIKSPIERLKHMLSSLKQRPLVLCGPGLESLASQLVDAEFVPIAQILNDNVPVTPVEHMLPLATSLAAVIFTSGSTGRPKGVMIEHRSIVRVAKQESYQIPVHASEENVVVSHLLNPAFDAAMMEIYTALLNGHTLYCVDESTVLDSHSLSEVFAQNNVKMAVFTPALLDHCLRETPVLFSGLRVLVVGGDRFKPSHARQLKRLVQGEVFNGYGPSENTVVSTLYRIPHDHEQLSENVPIGQAVTGSFAVVVDPQQRLVPPGVVGELIVGGDGLAKGYLDSTLDVDRFVNISINGELLRAYRTGDLARLRPSDMQLQFMGRMDHQVKIRGHRVETSEIDRVLVANSAVDSAATIAYIANTAQDADLVSFVTKAPGSRYADMGLDLALSNLGKDFVGWTSMYDGTEIPRHEMEEWLEDTIHTIQQTCSDGALGRVLEIGSGSGMMLFNLAPMSTEYVGVEPSLDAVNFVNSAIESITELKGKARAHQGTASAIGRWMGDCQPDLVVINSVSMYFPSAGYMYKIIEDCIGQLRPQQKTRLFFGDVRSYALYYEFLAHKAFHNAVEGMTLRDLRDVVDQQALREREMLVDPAFFTNLSAKYSGSIEHVQVLPKRMRTTNELSCFRYAAVIHLRGAEGRPLHVRDIRPDDWMDVTAQRLCRKSIERQLMDNAQSSSSSEVILALSNIPCSKFAADRLVVDAMRAPVAGSQQVADLAKQFDEDADEALSWDAAELHQLAQAAGLKVQISCARQYSQRGGIDAVFYRDRDGVQSCVSFRFPTDHDSRDSRTFCNQPIQVDDRTALQEELEAWARDKLPPYMMPKAVLVIDQMPLTNNGKLDHKALAEIATSEFAEAVKRDSARISPNSRSGSAIETKLRELWALVLDIPTPSISVDDHFVRKGGDSIKAMRLTAQARRHGLTLSIPDILTCPRLCDMAKKIPEEAVTPVLPARASQHNDIAPFELLQHTTEAEARSSAATQCDISNDSIEDIFPCTPLQTGLVALNLANPTDYIARHVKELFPGTDIDRFKRAFDDVVRAHSILRSRIIYLPGDDFVQVVTKDGVIWTSGSSVDQYVKKDRQDFVGLGTPLVRAAVIYEGSRRFFILTAHHALFDGWSMRILFDAVDRAYQSKTISPSPPFQSFIKALIEHNQSDTGKQAWKAHLMGHEAEQFPKLPNPDYRPRSDSVQHCRLQNLGLENMDVTAAVAVRAALAILISQRESVQDIVFGTTLTGRDSISVPGIEEMTGPTLTTLPTRITLSNSEETIGDFLVRLQTEWASLSRYEHMGIPAIRNLGEDALRATKFQTLLVVQPSEDSPKSTENGFSLFKHEACVRAADNDLGAISTYAMVMECQLSRNGISIRVTFDSAVVPEAQMSQMLSQYEAILRKLCLTQMHEQRLSEVEWLSETDISAIWSWNATIPEAVESAMHDLLSSTFHDRARAEAIRAWDGSLSYGELDDISTRLAYHLLDQQLTEKTTIAIYIEKSKWTAVSMLAVMKAGGTSCLLDPALPSTRLRSIVDQLDPKILVVSPQQEGPAKSLFKRQLVVVDAAHALHWDLGGSDRRLPAVDPSTPLYIVFTSGSTGVPKGVVISHGQFSSAIVHQHPRRSVGQDSRVYDFSSLAFDGSWFNLLHTLYAGGCVCIPSEADRQNDLSGSILKLGATFAFLTPTVASTLDVAALQALDSLEIGGEAADEEEMQKIQAHTTVRYIYGPSECTPITTMTEPGAYALSIGRPAGVLAWLVDPHYPERLVGVGCVAELWLEGPLVGSGYHNEPDRTAASFVENPRWMLRDRPGQPGRKGRAYRTGDLVRYQPDGSLLFVGRNNTQIKIRGQRVELLDVQHNVQHTIEKSLPGVSVIADVGGGNKDTLVAFIHMPSKSWTAWSIDQRISLLQEKASDVKEKLAGVVPKYMIPALFVPVESFPLSPTGKLDRRRLSAFMDGLTRDQRSACSLLPNCRTPTAAQSQPCMTERLRSLWATTLNVEVESITAEDNFFHRGGDSLLAMRLVNSARRVGILLRVADVWNWPQLNSLAKHLERLPSVDALPESVSYEYKATPRAHGQILSSETLPVTWSQHQFLNGTLNGYSAHVYYILVDVPHDFGIEQIKNACQQLFQHFDVLRTRFVCTPHRVHQIFDDFNDSQLPWQEVQVDTINASDAVQRFCEADRATLGTRPHPQAAITRFALVRTQQGPHKLVMRLCHAQYDGVSIPRILSTLTSLLRNDTPPPPARPFADYLRHIMAQSSKSYPYWSRLLQGTYAPTMIPPTQQKASAGVQLLRVSQTIPQPPLLAQSAQTPAIRFLASCAAMLAKTTSTHDVVFGCIVSGRNSVPQDLQDVCGPCLNEIPVRVTLPSTPAAITPQSAFDVLRQQMLESAAHDSVGFDEIAAHCTTWGDEVEDFGLTAHYQNSADLEGEVDGKHGFEVLNGGELPVPKANYVEVEAIPMDHEKVTISVMAKSSHYDEEFLQGLLEMVCSNYGM